MTKQVLRYYFAIFSIISNIYSAEPDILSSNKLLDSTSSVLYTQFVVGDLYNRQRPKLSKSSIYFFITAYNQERFAENLARSLKLNYARLSEFGVDFQIRLTCDGRTEDYEAFKRAFLTHIIPETNFIISLNEMNKGCSLTRYEQLIGSRDEIMKDIESGRNVYFSIFDGDDMIHQDYCLLMLAAALETNAESIGLTQMGVQCHEWDIPLISKLQPTSILKKSLQYEVADDSNFTPILFKAPLVYNNISFDFNFYVIRHGYKYPVDHNTALDTLTPILTLFKGPRFSISDIEFYQGTDLLNSVDITCIPSNFIPMFFYMQHSDSMAHNQLKDILGIYSKLTAGKKLDELTLTILNFDDIFLFGIHDHIHSGYIVTPDKNLTITEEFLISSFRNNHILAHIFKNTITESKFPYLAEDKTKQRIKYILEHPKMQELLAQDTSKPLPDEFIRSFYKDVFDIILGKKSLSNRYSAEDEID